MAFNLTDLSESLSLAIELDADDQITEVPCCEKLNGNGYVPLLEFVDPPPLAQEVVPRVSENLLVQDMKRSAWEQFELYLNPLSRGSMLNWEYLAAEYGFPVNKIMHLRTSSNPTSAVLHEIMHCRLNDLLQAICRINRIDLLLSLQQHFSEPQHVLLSKMTSSDSGVVNGSTSELEFSSASSLQRITWPIAPNTEHKASQEKFILVTHHENEGNEQSKRNFKWLLKNLRKNGKCAGKTVLDIDDYFEIGEQFCYLHHIFTDASSIVCVFTLDYLHMLKSTKTSQSTAIKQYVHRLMDAEFMENSGDNRRFRAVIFQGSNRDVLPIGWAKSSLVYEFPAHHLQLFKKIFEK